MSDPRAREEWFKGKIAQFEQRLIRYTTRITGNHEGAREVVQDAFLRLWQSEDEGLENVGAWLFRVCRNRAIDMLRKHNKIKTVSFDSVSGFDPSSEVIPTAEPDSVLMQALKSLPENQQEIVRLKFQEDMSYADISEVTGLSVSNVGYLLHMAIKSLRDTHTSSLQTSKKTKGRV
jgi:RNA polymerase sigma factor (sigma-70 family)